jgi:hypothetical protein
MKLVVLTKAVLVQWQEYNPFESTDEFSDNVEVAFTGDQWALKTVGGMRQEGLSLNFPLPCY